MLRVFIADDDELVRFGLRTLLSLKKGITVVAEADRTDRLLAGVSEHHPDLVLLDWELPERVDRTLLESLHATAGHPKIIVLSTRPEVEQPALAAGAEAFVCKADPPKRLVALLQEQARPGVDGQSESPQ